jgi:GxxExxY protein
MNIPDANSLTHRIIGLAMRVHTRLGPGLLESAYERCLCHEFDRDVLPYARQVDLPMDYDGVLLDCGCRADIIVNHEVILELKAVEHILPLHEAQLLTYLRLSQCRIRLLINFNALSLKDGIRRRVRPNLADRLPLALDTGMPTR